MELELPIEGRTAPPRKNGELQFEAPWQSRVFGLAVSLAEQGVFSWSDFKSALIAAISQWESRSEGEREEWCYYLCWQRALEQLLAEKGLCSAAELVKRSGELASRPHGHDH